MTKADFVKKVADKTGLSAAQANGAVTAFIEVVEESLKDGEEVLFAGFGKFSVSERAARQGVNPRDPSKRIEIAARRVPKFTPGTVLKRVVQPEKKAKAGAKKKK